MTTKLLAQQINIGGESLQGPLKLPGGEEATVGGLASVLSQFAIGAASIILLLILIWAGFDVIRSRGNPQKLSAARLKIVYAIVGYILLVSAFLITRLVANAFGLGASLFN
jgi:hypothetical protein